MRAASPWIGFGVPALFLLFWSGGFTFAKLGLRDAEPMTFLALRYVIALAAMLAAFAVLRPPLPKSPRAWMNQIVVGFLVQAVYFGFSYYGFALGVSAGGVALIVSLQPILVAILAPSLAGERVSAMRWAGLALGLDGAAIVILARSQIEATSGLGMGCVFLALAGMTAAALYEKRHGAHEHPVTANAIQYAVGAGALLPVAWFTETMQVNWTGTFILSLGYLVVCNSLIAVSLLLYMIRRGEVSKVSALLFLVPPGASLLAWPMLGEAIPLLAWPGLALAAIGVIVATRAR